MSNWYSVEEDCLYVRDFNIAQLIAYVIEQRYRNTPLKLYLLKQESENPGEYEYIGIIEYKDAIFYEDHMEYPVHFKPAAPMSYLNIFISLNKEE